MNQRKKHLYYYHKGVLAFMIVLLSMTSCGKKKVESDVSKNIDFSQVLINDHFWAPYLQRNARNTIPVCIDQIENQTGRMNNFINAAKRLGTHSGIYFDDSDVYKALEGFAGSLVNFPDKNLESKADQWIDNIAAAQLEDGYINTYYTLTDLNQRWTNMDKHEMYCAGHLIEAGVAYYKATGKDKLLRVGQKMADYMMTVFGPGKRDWVPGHEEIELALIKLYQVTGQKKYLDFSKWLLEERGHGYGVNNERGYWNTVYHQDDCPISQLYSIGGHAVRAMYLFCAMADVAAIDNNKGYLTAMDSLWNDVVNRNMYITGGIGSSRKNEGFQEDYDLPNLEAYCETCASVGMALWNNRMNLLKNDAKYMDVVEKDLYNGILSGVSLNGEKFFYVNPLESNGDHHRKSWYGTACCPSQLCRFMPSIGNYIYAITSKGICVNLFIGDKASYHEGKYNFTVSQKTEYPWQGDVKIEFNFNKKFNDQIRIRIPQWCKQYTLKVNNVEVNPSIEKGYAVLSQKWGKKVMIDFHMEMPIEVVKPDPNVKNDIGKVAIQRGPVVYCMEQCDNKDYDQVYISDETKFALDKPDSTLQGLLPIWIINGTNEYRMIPYYAWDNREAGKMSVWLNYK